MNARVLLILLFVALLLAVSRRYRRIGLWSSGVLLLLVVWQLINSVVNMEKPAVAVVAPAPSSASTSLALDTVQLQQMVLSGSGAPWLLTGEVTNTSTAQINAVKVQIIRRSCETVDLPDSRCEVLWQGEPTLRIRLLARDSQRVEEKIWSHSPVPRPKGVVRDSFLVTGLETSLTSN